MYTYIHIPYSLDLSLAKRRKGGARTAGPTCGCMADLRTNIMEFRGLDSSIILILRGGIPRPKGDFPESLSQAILVGIMLVGRLGVQVWQLYIRVSRSRRESASVVEPLPRQQRYIIVWYMILCYHYIYIYTYTYVLCV